MACSWLLNQTENGMKDLEMKGERERKKSDNFNEGKPQVKQTTSSHVLGYSDSIASQTEKWEEKDFFLLYKSRI